MEFISLFIINIENTSGDEGTILADVGFNYTDKLNDVNEANIKISGTGTVKRGLMEIGSKVEIQKDATRDFYGIIDSINTLDAGGLVFHVSGFEIRLADENGAYANSPWSSTASATIASEIIAESNYFTSGTIEAGTALDFRLALTESLLGGLGNLTKKSQQDIGIDYVNSEVDILDHKGSSSSVATLNDGIQIDNMRVNYGRPLGNYVIVYGKGDGDNQIKSTSAHGQDAGSQGTYGVIKRTIIDRSCMSEDEANTLADAECALTKDATKIYDFNVKNTSLLVVSGDHLLLNSTEKDLDSAEVRVVGIERGIRGRREYLTIQVTNPAYKQLVKARNSILARLKKQQRDADSYMQGATNIWGDTQAGNANASIPLILRVYIPPNVDDEAGNTNINTVKLSYKTGNYQGYSGALSGSTGNSVTNAGITNASSTTGAGITNASSTTGAGMTNAAKGASDSGYFFGGYSTSVTGDNTWRSVGTSINIGSSTKLFHGIFGSFSIGLYSASWVTNGQTYYVRAKNTTDTAYYPSSAGFKVYAGVSSDSYDILSIPFYIHIPLNWSSKNYELQYKITNQANWSSGGLVQTVYYSYHGSDGHTHSNSFNDASHTNNNSFNDASHTNNNSFNDANHQNPAGTLNADYSLSSSGSSSNNTSIKIYNGADALVWDSGARGQTTETDVDISSYLTANDYYRIEIYPNNNAYLHGTVFVKGGVDS